MENVNQELPVPFAGENPTPEPTLKDWCTTEPVYEFTDTYRTFDGQAHFTFGFARKQGFLEIDILGMPNYGGRPSSNQITHRMTSERNKFRIDTGDPTVINSDAMAKNLAGKWAELTWKYIQTGHPF